MNLPKLDLNQIIVFCDVSGSGGTEHYLSLATQYWIEKEEKNVVLVSTFHEEYDKYDFSHIKKRISIYGKEVSCSRSGLGVFGFADRVYKLFEVLKDLGPNGIIISFLTVNNIIALIAGLFLSNKIIISERNNICYRPEKMVVNLLRRLLYVTASAITSNSHETIQQLSRYIYKERLYFIRNGVLPCEKSTNAKSNSILYTGRLEAHKNIELIIYAFNEMISDPLFQEWRLFIVGDGSMYDLLINLIADLRIESKVIVTGRVENVCPYIKISKIFVLASDYEGTSNSLLEAAVSGLSCAVSNNLRDAELDYIAKNGKLNYFRQRDFSDLSGVLKKLAKFDSSDCVSSNVVNNFSAEASMADWSNAITAVCNKIH